MVWISIAFLNYNYYQRNTLFPAKKQWHRKWKGQKFVICNSFAIPPPKPSPPPKKCFSLKLLTRDTGPPQECVKHDGPRVNSDSSECFCHRSSATRDCQTSPSLWGAGVGPSKHKPDGAQELLSLGPKEQHPVGLWSWAGLVLFYLFYYYTSNTGWRVEYVSIEYH